MYDCQSCYWNTIPVNDAPCTGCISGEREGTLHRRTKPEPMMKVIDAIELVNSIDFTCGDRAYESVQIVLDKLEGLRN